jgi:hypothetical protein
VPDHALFRAQVPDQRNAINHSSSLMRLQYSQCRQCVLNFPPGIRIEPATDTFNMPQLGNRIYERSGRAPESGKENTCTPVLRHGLESMLLT